MMYPTFFKKGQKGVHSAARLAVHLSGSVLGVALLSSAALAAVAYALPVRAGPSLRRGKTLPAHPGIAAGGRIVTELAGSVLSGADLQAHRVWSSAGGLLLTVAAALIGAMAAGPLGAAIGYLIGHFLAALSMIAAIIACRRDKPRLQRKGATDVRSISLD